MKHNLKTWPKEFGAILSGDKRFDLRKNDRGYEVGDILNQQEFDPDTNNYSGREREVKVLYIMRDDNPLMHLDGHVIMSIKLLRQSLISKLWNKIFDLN